MSADKSKGGRPPAPPGLRRVNVPLRLPEWLVQWMSEQAETPAELIEAALLKAHKLRPNAELCGGTSATNAVLNGKT